MNDDLIGEYTCQENMFKNQLMAQILTFEKRETVSSDSLQKLNLKNRDHGTEFVILLFHIFREFVYVQAMVQKSEYINDTVSDGGR